MARIVFLGTPEYAVPVLRACLQHHEVVYAVTQPDRYGGRGRRQLIGSPVKMTAADAGVPILQPVRLSRDAEALSLLEEAQADVFVLAAYGQILRPNVLALPRHGVIGVHASLLPRWRGASPVAAAIRAGDADTGVSLMLTEAGLDTGPVIAWEATPVGPHDTTGSLTARLADLGATLLIDTLPAWVAGQIRPQQQDEALATYAPEIAKADGRIDWSQSAVAIERHIRAMSPWPGAFTFTAGDTRLTLWQAHVLEQTPCDVPGTIQSVDGALAVATGDGMLCVDLLQPAGRRTMPGDAYLRGQPDLAGTILR